MNPGHPDGLCEYCQLSPIIPSRSRKRPSPRHDDLILARTLAGSVVWTRDLCSQLAALVDRNKRTGSPLGYEGYIAMRELLSRVRSLLDAQETAARALF
jgi:hypothetical protein